MSRALYEHGVWAIFSSLDKRVLQWKPGVLLTAGLCEEILDRFDAAMPRARELLRAAEQSELRSEVMSEALMKVPDAQLEQARMMLDRARWAAAGFQKLDRAAVRRIAEAVANAGHAKAQHYAEWAVRETGMGVVEHKRIKNEACSKGIFELYGG